MFISLAEQRGDVFFFFPSSFLHFRTLRFIYHAMALRAGRGAIERPRSIAIMVLLLAAVSYIAFKEWDCSPHQRAALAAVVMLVGYGVLHCRDSVLVNPHPLFWRMTHSIGVCYLLFLVMLLALGKYNILQC